MDIGLKRAGKTFWSIETALEQFDDSLNGDYYIETMDNNLDGSASLDKISWPIYSPF